MARNVGMVRVFGKSSRMEEELEVVIGVKIIQNGMVEKPISMHWR
ncbi:MAG: hypothetical protein ACI8YQ_002378 [Polaribacter sp.]|jgi:hypothetical protein